MKSVRRVQELIIVMSGIRWNILFGELHHSVTGINGKWKKMAITSPFGKVQRSVVIHNLFAKLSTRLRPICRSKQFNIRQRPMKSSWYMIISSSSGISLGVFIVDIIKVLSYTVKFNTLACENIHAKQNSSPYSAENVLLEKNIRSKKTFLQLASVICSLKLFTNQSTA